MDILGTVIVIVYAIMMIGTAVGFFVATLKK